MIQSMTGFGKGDTSIGNSSFSIEIKSVNHRFLDTRFRLPSTLSFLELSLIDILKSHFERGSFEINVRQKTLGNAENSSNIKYTLDEEVARSIIEGCEKLHLKFGTAKIPSLEMLFGSGRVFIPTENVEDMARWVEGLKTAFQAVLKDVKTMPHSVLVLGNAGARWVDLADTKEVTGKNVPGQDSTRFNDYNGTLKITDADILEFNSKDRFITQALIGKTTRNIGKLNELYQAIEDAKQALAQSGAPTTESYKTALKTLNQLKDKLGDLKRTAALNKGIKFLKHAIELHPRYVNGYLNLGLASFKLKNDYDALFYWKYNAERLYPNNPYLRSYYQVYEIELRNRGALAAQRGRWDSAAIAYNKWTLLMPQNSDAWTSLSGAYFNQAKFALSLKSAQEAVKFNPGNAEAKRIIGMISPQMLGIVTQPTQVPAVASKSR